MNLPDEMQQTFKDAYIKALKTNTPLGVTEIHLEDKAPLFLDLDFRWPIAAVTSIMERQYDHDKHVVPVIKAFVKAIIDNCEDLRAEDLDCYVLEKERPSCAKGKVKDGLHLHFPNAWFKYDELFAIFDKGLEMVRDEKIIDSLGCCNSLDDIFDKAPLRQNPLLLYGSRKTDNGLVYGLSGIVRSELDGTTTSPTIPSNITIDELYDTLSIRRKDAKVLCVSKSLVVKKQPDFKKMKVKMNRKYDELNQSYSCDMTDELKKDVRTLLGLLTDDYVDEYPKWRQVGSCLLSIHPGLLEIGKEWSMTSEKYEEGCCEKNWRAGNKTIASLIYWVKLCNPVGYNGYKSAKDKQFFDVAPSVITNYDIAKRLHDKYHDTLICSSLRASGGEWYIYDGIRWKVNHGGIFLRNKMSTELVREFREMANQQQHLAIESPSDDSSSKKADAFNKCSRQLKQTRFKNETMTQCSELFFDAKFYENLDENPMLVGFENGVLDLENREFRSGLPEDSISFTTGINYIPLEDIDPKMIEQIDAFMCQILPIESVRNYVLTMLASCLEGKSLEDFTIWTGSGGNGKSKLLELFQNCYGDYCKNLPVSLLTNQRAASNAASPELAQTKSVRAIYFQEPDENTRINTGLMKELSGNDKIQCRALFKEPIEFKPQFKMWMLCNKLPECSATDGGTWRRMKVVEFKSEFVDNPVKPNQFKKDMQLSSKLSVWPEGFMAILVDRYFNIFKKVGLRAPREVTKYTNEYQKKNNYYKEFVEECLSTKEGSSITLKDTYARFRDWFKDTKGLKAPQRNEVCEFLSRTLEYNSRSKCYEGVEFAGSDDMMIEIL